MAGKNYELIYKMRKLNTNSLSNIRVALRNQADVEASRIHGLYLEALIKELGHANFEVSDVSCIADGIMNHVYVCTKEGDTDIHLVPRGSGRRICVYCGCDDFDM